MMRRGGVLLQAGPLFKKRTRNTMPLKDPNHYIMGGLALVLTIALVLLTVVWGVR